MGGRIFQKGIKTAHDFPAPVNIGQDGRCDGKTLFQHFLSMRIVIAYTLDEYLADHIMAICRLQHSAHSFMRQMSLAQNSCRCFSLQCSAQDISALSQGILCQGIGVSSVGRDHISDPANLQHLTGNTRQGPSRHRNDLNSCADRILQDTPRFRGEFLLPGQERAVQIYSNHLYHFVH